MDFLKQMKDNTIFEHLSCPRETFFYPKDDDEKERLLATWTYLIPLVEAYSDCCAVFLEQELNGIKNVQPYRVDALVLIAGEDGNNHLVHVEFVNTKGMNVEAYKQRFSLYRQLLATHTGIVKIGSPLVTDKSHPILHKTLVILHGDVNEDTPYMWGPDLTIRLNLQNFAKTVKGRVGEGKPPLNVDLSSIEEMISKLRQLPPT